ncbi:hypothetical protein HYW36_01985 [Candidatus Saccharibacteria bacterium]|nr:hypothetical protein [Candidatus Saccharibacteria bacterium]
MAIVILFTTSATNAVTSFSWINDPLAFQKGSDTTAAPTSLNSNIDCHAQDSSTCAVPTTYGGASQNGTVRLNGTEVFRPVITYVDNRQHFLGVPNSATVISYTTEPPYGFYLYFNYNFGSSITRVPVFGGGIQYQINRPPDGKLVDKTNRRLAADYGSLNFSKNGQWMVVSMPNVAMLRVNLQTFEVIPFAGGFNYTIGIDPAIRTAISNDGRYAAVSSKGFNTFKIYDLDTCAPTPNTITGPVLCRSRDLKSFINQRLPGYSFSSNVEFINNDGLSFYGTYLVGTNRKTAKILIGASGSIAHQLDLLGVGESYISGEGAFNYQSGTDTADNKCHLSLISYPYLIGRDLNYNSYHSVACSGGRADDITNSGLDYRGQAQNRTILRSERTAQDVDSIFASFKPGYVNQSDFVSRYQPKVILLSIGGNDIGFSKIVTRCAAPWELTICYSNYEDRLELVREMNNQVFPRLVQTYQTIKSAGAPDSRIYVIGYPQIAKPGGNCALNIHLNQEEILFSEQLISYLNTVIKLATLKAGVSYVDTEDAFNGHRLCEAKPGSVAINGLTLGNDAPFSFGPIGNESYHPNDLGHQLLENNILATTHNLTDPMPIANLSIIPPSEANLGILNAPPSGRAVSALQYDDNISDNLVFAQSSAPLIVDGSQHALKPLTSYRVELHSDPVILGSYSTDATGNLNTQIQIPTSTSPGEHSLHIYGTNLAGDSIDVYKSIYVGASSSDYDGDGIPNSSDNCVFIAPSGQDYDQDGIDDACDDVISEPPPAELNQNPTEQLPTLPSQPLMPALPVSVGTSSSGFLNQDAADVLDLVFTTFPQAPAFVNQTSSPASISGPTFTDLTYAHQTAPTQSLILNRPTVLSAKTNRQTTNSHNRSTKIITFLTGGVVATGLAAGIYRKYF